METPSIISLSAISSKENMSSLYIIKGEATYNQTKDKVRKIFSTRDTKDFIMEFEKLLHEFNSALKSEKIEDNEWILASENLGNGMIYLIDLKMVPKNTFILSLTRSIWTNPKNPTEKQISFEAHFYSREGVKSEFQRVLIMKGGEIYDAILKS